MCPARAGRAGERSRRHHHAADGLPSQLRPPAAADGSAGPQGAGAAAAPAAEPAVPPVLPCLGCAPSAGGGAGHAERRADPVARPHPEGAPAPWATAALVLATPTLTPAMYTSLALSFVRGTSQVTQTRKGSTPAYAKYGFSAHHVWGSVCIVALTQSADYHA